MNRIKITETLQRLSEVLERDKFPLNTMTIELVGQDYSDAKQQLLKYYNLTEFSPEQCRNDWIKIFWNGFHFYIRKFNSYKMSHRQ